MSSMKNASTHNEALEYARANIRQSFIFPMVRTIKGPIIEVCSNEKQGVFIRRHASGAEYSPEGSALTPMPVDAYSGEHADTEAKFAMWIFGPERVPDPAVIYRMLSRILPPDGDAIVASDTPWPGKILCPGEFGEYTPEEISAALVRSGFSDISERIEGPFLRIYRGRRSTGSGHLALIDAETYLNHNDWHEAEKRLGDLSEQLSSRESIREYALLVAACHDLAGRSQQCLEALSDALSLDPYCARAMCGMGRIAALGGDLDNALGFFNDALKYQPAMIAALHGKAAVMEAQGELKKAFSLMMMASDLRPGNSDLMIETVRIGKAAGKSIEVSRFLEHRREVGTFNLFPKEDSKTNQEVQASF